MISSEVQRTLVKSPPELWAEISDPDALARHLGEFGEIRITRVQPEQKVEWEAPDASGSIVIKPSGWGTKVKLTVTRELGEAKTGAEPDQASEPGEEAAIVPVQEPKGVAESAVEVESEVEVEPESSDESESDPLLEPAGESDPHTQPELEPEPARRLGFFARLFGRRRAARTGADEPGLPTFEIADDGPSNPALVSDELSPSDEASAPATEAAIGAEAELEEAELDAELTPAPADGPNSMNQATPAQITPPTPGVANGSEHPSPTDADAAIAAELEQAEDAAEEQVTAVLTGVLDRLGAAHHRPFSRA
jgi:hypothetical protein